MKLSCFLLVAVLGAVHCDKLYCPVDKKNGEKCGNGGTCGGQPECVANTTTTENPISSTIVSTTLATDHTSEPATHPATNQTTTTTSTVSKTTPTTSTATTPTTTPTGTTPTTPTPTTPTTPTTSTIANSTGGLPGGHRKRSATDTPVIANCTSPCNAPSDCMYTCIGESGSIKYGLSPLLVLCGLVTKVFLRP